eukprot:8306485-Pyramimonas_sp.AAC.1
MLCSLSGVALKSHERLSRPSRAAIGRGGHTDDTQRTRGELKRNAQFFESAAQRSLGRGRMVE